MLTIYDKNGRKRSLAWLQNQFGRVEMEPTLCPDGTRNCHRDACPEAPRGASGVCERGSDPQLRHRRLLPVDVAGDCFVGLRPPTNDTLWACHCEDLFDGVTPAKAGVHVVARGDM